MEPLEPFGISPKATKTALGCGTTKLYQLINEGELECYFIGRSRRITTESIKAYVARQIAKQREAA